MHDDSQMINLNTGIVVNQIKFKFNCISFICLIAGQLRPIVSKALSLNDGEVKFKKALLHLECN